MMTFAKAVLSYGLPRAIMLDNGRDFRAKKFSGGRRRQRELFIEADQDRARSILGVLLVEAQFVTAYLARAKPIERSYGFFEERLKERMPFGTGTEQLRPAIREQRRAKKLTRDAVEAVQNLREQPTVQDVLQQMNEEAEAAQRKAAQLRATGTDGRSARGTAKRQAKQKRPRLRVVGEPDHAPARAASDNLRELADLLASQVQSDPEGSESW